MSKHKNYTNYQNMHKATPVEVTPAVEPIEEVNEVVEEVEDVAETATVTMVEETVDQEPVKPVYGTVVDCVRLNVRKAPTKAADVLCEVEADSQLEIDMAGSTKDWYKVNAPKGVVGFCMKKFIEVA